MTGRCRSCILDKPGTRALRRKLDDKFHFVVGTFDLVRRASLASFFGGLLQLKCIQHRAM